jgi:hypothetical protein
MRFEPLEPRTPLAADITTGLIHHWTFDETSGDTAADSAGSNGTLVGWAASEPKWIAGRVGGAIRFDTADNYVVATPPALSGSYAVSFWINAKDKSGINPRIFQAKAGNDIYVNMESNRGVGFSAANTNTISPDPPTFNTWEHYALNFNAGTGQGVVYRSGAPVAIGLFADSDALSSWFFGHSADTANTSNSFKGGLDDLRVYSRLLADDDIAALASLGTPEPTHQEPVHHWTFDETTGFTAHDTAGGADGVLLNWNQTEPRWEPGVVGGALRFSTTDNAVVTPLVATGAKWTTAFWLNVQARSGINPRVLEPWAYINLENNQGIGFNSRNQLTFDSTPVTLDKWEHYAITYDTINDIGTIYRNGIAVKSGPFFDNAPASAWVFGHQSGDLGNHNDSLDGLLDDIRHYDRLLSPSEIQSLAGQSNPLPPTEGMIHHWTFDETIGNIAADIAGGNDGELRNYGPTQSKWVPGKIRGAISFTDADDLVITETPITEDRYTFSFWLNQTGDGGFNPRLINPGDEDWLVLWQFADRGITFSDSAVWDPRMATRNAWEHYAVTLDQTSNRVEFYRGGVLVASGNYPDKPPPIKQWVMGHSGTLTHHVDTLHGMLDDMRIYDFLLAPTEIQQLAQLTPLVATPDAYSTREDSPLIVDAAAGLMGNDTDLDFNTRVVVDVFPAHGQLTLNEDGSFTYLPATDYSGADSFTYHLVSATSTSTPATVALNVTPVNDAPTLSIFIDPLVLTDEHPRVFRVHGERAPSVTFQEWFANRAPGPATAMDESEQVLTLSVSADNPGLFADQPAIDHNGWLTFTPAPNVAGTAVLTVTIEDDGGTADGGLDTAVRTLNITVEKPHRLHNVAEPKDVALDGQITAFDVLAIVNFINAFGARAVPADAPIGPVMLDVTGDNLISANDALVVINDINSGGAGNLELPGQAEFLGVDATTQGTWQGKYGSRGYALNSALTSLPPQVDINLFGGLTDLYDGIAALTTNDPRALQKPGTSDRLAASWTGDHGFTLDLNLQDGQAHQVALYMLDFSRVSQMQRLDVIDAITGQILDTRDVTDFGDGRYLSWSLRGHIQIRFINTANGKNATLSGIFFD